MSLFAFSSENILSLSPIAYNARKAPFRIHGLYKPEKEGVFRRMPTEVAETVNGGVKLLHKNTAGARVRFATDSSFIAVGAYYPPMEYYSKGSAALSGLGAFCFDLYADGRHVQVLQPECLTADENQAFFDIKDGHYEAFANFGVKKMREITLFFPSFVNVEEIFIGLEADALVEPATPYKNEKPVVIYGSSITQGACASRAGNTYPSILSRRHNFDFINLGFAGSAQAENAIIDYLCSLEASMLVFDYDHNSPNPDFLRRTHLRALRKLRAAHPDIPFILLSRPNLSGGEEAALERIEIIKESLHELENDGCGPVHFVSGNEIFKSCDSEMMTADNTHPTDLGFYAMAAALDGIFSLCF